LVLKSRSARLFGATAAQNVRWVADGNWAGDQRPVAVPLGINTVYAALVPDIADLFVSCPAGRTDQPVGAQFDVLRPPAARGADTTMTTTMPTNQMTTHMTTNQPANMTTPTTWNDGEWRAHAACSNFDTNLFFPEPEATDALAQIARAKAVCAACPVRENCLEFAIRTRQLDGVWGGHTPEERRSIRRRRQAAARKAAA
jgi:WhiB family transcriptional regulator, redox-sensing transcriptional regulator